MVKVNPSPSNPLRTVRVVARHDLGRFLANPGRILNVLVFPLIPLLCVGTGFSAVFREHAGIETGYYFKWMIPGFIIHVAMYSAKNCAAVVMRDRETGLLDLMLLTSPRPTAVIAGKLLSAFLQALAYGVFLLLLIPLLQIYPTLGEDVTALGLIALAAMAVNAIFFAMALTSRTYEQFSRNSQMVSLIAYFLGGAVFPLDSLEGLAAWLAWANPVTYMIDAMRNLLLRGELVAPFATLLPLGTDVAVMAGFALAATLGLIIGFPRWASR